jgi:Flp pilus assembly protein TadG
MRRIGRRNKPGGQALVEFALVIPFLFLFIVNVVNFGGFFFAWITVANAARAGAQYAVMAGATVTAPTPATGAQIASIITTDVSALPNRASLSVRICTNNNGVLTLLYPVGGTCPTSGSAAIAADPEPTNYVLASIDVTYTYLPLVAAWDFNRLNIHLTLPATTIHRRSVMRMLQ